MVRRVTIKCEGGPTLKRHTIKISIYSALPKYKAKKMLKGLWVELGE